MATDFPNTELHWREHRCQNGQKATHHLAIWRWTWYGELDLPWEDNHCRGSMVHWPLSWTHQGYVSNLPFFFSYPVLISALSHSVVRILSWHFLWFPQLEPQAALGWTDWPMGPSVSDTTCSIPRAAECLGSQDTWLLGLALPLVAWLWANHITSLGLSVHTWEMKGLHYISDSLLLIFFSLPNLASDIDLLMRHTHICNFLVLITSLSSPLKKAY